MANTIIFNQRRGKVQGGGGGDVVEAGKGIEITKENNNAIISATVDNKTIVINANNQLEARENQKENQEDIVGGKGITITQNDEYKRTNWEFYEYLNAASNFYIQTDITDLTNISFDITIRKNSSSGKGFNNILGCVSSVDPKKQLQLYCDPRNYKIKLFYGTDTEGDVGYFEFPYKILSNVINVKFNKKLVKFTNVTTGETAEFENKVDGEIISDKALQISGITNAPIGGSFWGSLGNCKLSVDGVMYYDLVPMKKPKDPLVTGWLNLVNNRFHKTPSTTSMENLIDAPDYTRIEVKEFKGATTKEDGEIGAVPKPTISDKNKFLKGDGTWTDVSGGGYTTGDGIKIEDGVISQNIIAYSPSVPVDQNIKLWIKTK